MAGLFQFHYGMIGRPRSLFSVKAVTVFQFHYGMIGRTIRMFLPASLPSFNSTMGWLEDQRPAVVLPCALCFNSTMGWLEDHRGSGIVVPKQFQFHYGMIGSAKEDGNTLYLIGFNSTMGWLEGQVCGNSGREDLVSIPLWDDWKSLLISSSVPYFEFQFHYGMIGSVELAAQVRYVGMFQFHYGMIGRVIYRYRPNYSAVSIPLWDDWKIYNFRKIAVPQHVSIPLWDDWKKFPN